MTMLFYQMMTWAEKHQRMIMHVKEIQMDVHPWVDHQRVIVFDGVCNFCNASVDFVIARDPQKKYKFSTLQSDPGQTILREFKLNTQDFETFLYIEQGQVLTRSTAALRVARGLSGLWTLLYGFIVIPAPIRDTLYKFIARRRYQWMGKRDLCRVPKSSERARFV